MTLNVPIRLSEGMFRLDRAAFENTAEMLLESAKKIMLVEYDNRAAGVPPAEGGTVSAPDTQESKSSVTVTTNAKGEVQHAVKVYEGVTRIEMLRLAGLAMNVHGLMNDPVTLDQAIREAIAELGQDTTNVHSLELERLQRTSPPPVTA